MRLPSHRIATELRASGILMCLAAFASPVTVFAQAKVKTVPDDKVPHYDVVTIKPNKTGSGRVSIGIDDEDYEAQNLSLKSFIANAWNIKEDLITDLPGWAQKSNFDIHAKVVDPDKKMMEALTDEQYRSMQLAILTERFHLKAHIEMKILPVYDLVIAKTGLKMKASGETKELNGLTPGSMRTSNQHITALAVTIDKLVYQLEYQLHHPIVNKTGLAETYDIDLVWTREDATPNPDATDAPPGIFTAIQEQLGLKLEGSKGPVKTLVIDQIDPPTED